MKYIDFANYCYLTYPKRGASPSFSYVGFLLKTQRISMTNLIKIGAAVKLQQTDKITFQYIILLLI